MLSCLSTGKAHLVESPFLIRILLYKTFPQRCMYGVIFKASYKSYAFFTELFKQAVIVVASIHHYDGSLWNIFQNALCTFNVAYFGRGLSNDLR